MYFLSAPRRVAATMVLLATMGCGGAGPKLVPAEGSVTLDGNPLEGANVSFHPAQADLPTPIGRTDAQGHFVLEVNGQAGATPGKYKVVVSKVEMPSVPAADFPIDNEREAPAFKKKRLYDKSAELAKQLVPAVYANLGQTTLEIEVPAEGKTDIAVTLTN